MTVPRMLLITGALTLAGFTSSLRAQPVVPTPAMQPEPTGIAAARATLARLRLAPERLDLRLLPAAEPSYTIAAAGGRARIDGTSAVALVRGAYGYWNAAGAASLSWEGDRIALPARLPGMTGGRVTSPFAHRVYLNTCTYGYTTPFWDWARWEREIDWMAAQGVDMPLALEGQEYVWRALWRETGLSDAAIGTSLSGPAFLPWQRMGNIEGYRSPLSANWIDDKHALQRRILSRMRALGMTPVLPAFAGYVPKAFADAHPRARIYKMRAWEGFNATYWLDPSDPLFAVLAKRFIDLYTREYGAGQFYLADAFNEMVPPIAEDGSDAANATYGDSIANTAATRAAALPPAVRAARLAAYGERLHRSIADAAPGATWVMQGWLFGADNHFWTPDAIAAFLSKVPDQRMLVLDIGNDRYPGIWRDTKAFGGKNWVYGYVHNYGGSNPVYGDLDFYRSDLATLAAAPDRGRLTGFGMFPEGLHSNSLVYANAYDLAWGRRATSTTDWLHRHLAARYGTATPALDTAWAKIAAGAYATRYWTPRWWEKRAGAYLFFKRPTGTATAWAAPPGDPAALRAGIAGLLAQAPRLRGEALYRYDLVDVTRHYALLRLDARVQRALLAYAAGDVASGDRAVAGIEPLARAIDLLLGNQQETLSSWIDMARAYARSPEDERAFVTDAKAQVTIWGGEGNLADYASKAWAGLVADFYLPRWQHFLRERRAAAIAGTPFDDTAVRRDIRDWEQHWVKDTKTYRRIRPHDVIAQARTVLTLADAQ
ncbi:alpha-N-acetylglucosaminidase [Sphingomonas sp. Leaf10]|uniref:alpha-N-acetylglucosaminidase n=1 Tax=Sphingomonas sp. Leaf10 TaxID=1735676 RepID=UPI000A40B4A8|nr:alpha-N-acetylglucosaminidase [Sphingomonas sp. Leaf10]